jgi:hypothetical protein
MVPFCTWIPHVAGKHLTSRRTDSSNPTFEQRTVAILQLARRQGETPSPPSAKYLFYTKTETRWKCCGIVNMARTWADDTWPVTTMPPNSPCCRPTSSVPFSLTIPVSAIRTILPSQDISIDASPKQPPLLLVAVPPPARPTSGFVHRTLDLMLTTACLCVFVCLFLGNTRQ